MITQKRNLFELKFKFNIFLYRNMSGSLGESFYVLFPDHALHLKKKCRTNISKDSSSRTFALSNNLNKGEFLVFQPQPRHLKKQSTYTKTAVISQRLLRNLSNQEEINPVISLTTESTSDVVRGIAVYSTNPEVDHWSESTVKAALELDFKQYLTFCRVDCNTYHATVKGCEYHDVLEEAVYSVDENSQPESIIFTNKNFSPVLHDRSYSRIILEDYTDMDEVKELLGKYDSLVPADICPNAMSTNMKHPFIVVEGLDATGKTTLTQTLEEKLKAVRYYTPPPPVEHLRKHFDALPEIVRRAYYSLGNYIVAMEISKECQERPVIMDRYWHSTAAYGIANETSNSDLPRKGHWVYKWPEDLLRPTVVLFLTVSEEIRKERLSGRATEKTFEEKHLDRDKLFRERLCTAYRRMEDPNCIEIDASGDVKSVVDASVKQLQHFGINI